MSDVELVHFQSRLYGEGAPCCACSQPSSGMRGLPTYNGDIEVIDAIRAWRLDLDFCRANAIKYIVRAGKKDPAKFCEDLEKAIWYLQQRLKWERSEQAQIAAPQGPPLGDFDWITAFHDE